jgi:hypothetical protein
METMETLIRYYKNEIKIIAEENIEEHKILFYRKLRIKIMFYIII